MRNLTFLACSALLLAAGVSTAEVAPQCDVPHEVDRYQLLRRLSVDLRGRVPTVEEYAALDSQPSVPRATIASYLATDDFRLAMRRYHEAMFWPNIQNVALHGIAPVLTLSAAETSYRLGAAARGNTYRGDANTGCGDFEQTHFDPAFPGEFRPDPAFVQIIVVNGKNVRQEGWRMVSPYWAPATQLKVCAFDAQETPSVKAGGVTLGCNYSQTNNNPACGCGPNLKFCYGGRGEVDRKILTSLREQLNLAVDDVVKGGKPYTDLLLSTKAQQNGPIAFWKTWLAPQVTVNQTYNVADPQEEVSAKDYLDESWTTVDRKGLHAGVVTLPGYLLRFQTDRGRANRWRINFLCEHFIPPAVLQPQAGCSDSSSDLTQRCNCQYCHSKLEPMAAHWGKFAEAGTTLMTDPLIFPLKRTQCIGQNNAFCNRFYVTQSDGHNPGSLLAYQFTDTHADYLTNLEGGPRALAQKAIDDGSFARCTVKKVFEQLVKRELQAEGAETAELELQATLAQGFKDNAYSFPWLVEQVVSLPQYRRVR
jgi:hypothetical protein